MGSININRITSILEKQNNINFACLFGSSIKNKIRYGSDLDIAVYFDSEPNIHEFGELVLNLEKESDSKIDLVKLNNLDKENPRLAYSILSNAKLIYTSDNNLFSTFRSAVMLQYLDFKFVSDLFDSAFNKRLSTNNFAVFDK